MKRIGHVPKLTPQPMRTRRQTLADKNVVLQAEILRLRKAIEDAPHDEYCLNYNDGVFTRDPRYNCKCLWKRNALEGE